MKYVKILGLAAVAAAALMAFVGAGTASATVLCKEGATSGCASAYGKGTTIEATLSSGNSATLTGSNGLEDTCTTSKIKGSTGNAGSSTETVSGSASALTFTNCNFPTTTTKLGTLEIHWISGTDNGTVTASGFEVTVEQLFGSCVYKSGTGNDLGTLVGGSSPSINIKTNVTGGGAFGCSSSATWEASYTVTNPTPLFVSTS